MPRTIDVYFSIISPWAHLGHAPFMALADRASAAIEWRPLPLGPLFAETGGLPLAKRAIERRRYRDVELMRWAERRGRPLKLRPRHWPFDASHADRAALALIALGHNPAPYLEAAMRGVWEEDRDLAAPGTIAELIAGAGFDADAALARADSPDIAETYEDNRVRGQRAGVFGSPTYVLDGETFWGQDRLDLLEDALDSGRRPFVAPDA